MIRFSFNALNIFADKFAKGLEGFCEIYFKDFNTFNADYEKKNTNPSLCAFFQPQLTIARLISSLLINGVRTGLSVNG